VRRILLFFSAAARFFCFVLGVCALKLLLLLLLLIIRVTLGCSTLVTSHVKEKVRTCDPC
jgi:hypothetical protein